MRIAHLSLLLLIVFGFAACKKKDNTQPATGNVPGLQYDFSWGGWQLKYEPISFISSAPDNSSFFWDFGDGQTSTEARPVHAYQELSAGYKVRLVINGDEAHAITKTVEIGEAVNFFYQSWAVPGDTVRFELSQTPPTSTTYLWDFGDGGTATDAAPYHIYTAPGTYTIKCKLNGTKEVAAGQKRTIEIIADPMYTHKMTGTKTWKMNLFREESGKKDTAYAYTEDITITMIDKLRLSVQTNNSIAAPTLFYQKSKSTPDMLVFDNFGKVEVRYYVTGDSMTSSSFTAYLGNHSNPGFYQRTTVKGRTP